MAHLGCTQAEAGELVVVGDRAMGMYIAGAKDPAVVAALLGLLVAGMVNGDDVRWALKRRPLGLGFTDQVALLMTSSVTGTVDCRINAVRPCSDLV
jgi:hypothetical protein